MNKTRHSLDSRWIINLFCLVPLLVIVKFIFGVYLYPRQDSIIYQTFRLARKYPENYARDIFASLEKTHFDFFWHFATNAPDNWLVEPDIIMVTLVTWLILFSGIYFLTYSISNSHISCILGIFAMIWSKHFFGLTLFGHSFIHPDLIYGFAFFSLSLFFVGHKLAAIAALGIISNLYPPIAYFFIVPLFLFILREERLITTIKYSLVYLLFFSPLLFNYYQRGVLDFVITTQSETAWKDYFLINLETIFRLFPLTAIKISYISSFIASAIIYFLVASYRNNLSSTAQIFIRCWGYFLGYSIICILLTWSENSIALKLQLLRSTTAPVVFSLIGVSLLAADNWKNSLPIQRVILLLSLVSSHLAVVLLGTIFFLHSNRIRSLVPSGAMILLILVTLTANIGFPPIFGREKLTPWFDVASKAKVILPQNSLTLIPPVADMNFCETEDYITFRLLAQRSTTLKLSDGVEVSYSAEFAKLYIDYITKLSNFLERDPDFSDACSFKQSFYDAWTNRSVSEIKSFANSLGADYLLIRNSHKGFAESSAAALITGNEYSIIKVSNP